MLTFSLGVAATIILNVEYMRLTVDNTDQALENSSPESSAEKIKKKSSKNSVILNVVGLVIIPIIGFCLFLFYAYSGFYNIEKKARDVSLLTSQQARFTILANETKDLKNFLSISERLSAPQNLLTSRVSAVRKASEAANSTLNIHSANLFNSALDLQKASMVLVALWDKKVSLATQDPLPQTRLTWVNDQIQKQKNQIQETLATFESKLNEAQTYQQKLVNGKLQDISLNKQSQLFFLALIAGGCLVIFLLLSFGIAKRISAPMSHLRKKMESFNQGNLTENIDGLNRNDEFGDIARLLLEFRENAQNIHKLQIQLKSTIAGKRKAAQMKENVLTQMGHDMKKPLNSMLGYSELIQKDIKTAQQTGKIDFAKVSTQLDSLSNVGHGMVGMVESVIDLTSESDDADIEPIIFNVREEVQQILPQIEVEILKNKNKFRVVCPDASLSMTSDPGKMTKALGCLIKNAASATESGTITLEIHKANLGEYDAVKFVVIDNGAGLDHDRIKDLNNTVNQDDFDIYSIGKLSSAKGNKSGSGLGLILVKKITKALHGVISAERNRIKGTKITITFPCDFERAALGSSRMALPALSDAI